jgi:hypothetical protein
VGDVLELLALRRARVCPRPAPAFAPLRVLLRGFTEATEAQAMSRPAFTLAEVSEGVAVVETATGAVVAFTTELRGFRLVRLLNALAPTGEQVAVLVGEGAGARLLHTITLRHDAICCRCGGCMPAGIAARWHPFSKLMRHPRRCPAASSATQAEGAA